MASRAAASAPDTQLGPVDEVVPSAARVAPDEDEARRARAFSAREISDVVTRGAREGLALARQNQILDTLRTATKQLVVHRPLDELFELLLDLLFAAVPAERGAILLLEGERQTPLIKAARSRAGQRIKQVSRSIARRVLDEGVALLLPNALEDPNFGAADSVIFSQVRSALCAPLWTETGDRDSVVGLVYLDTCQLTGAFDEDDLGLVTALANVAAIKIQNACLLEDRVERQRLEEEMRLAAQVQASLLPHEPPDLEGYSLAGSNRACHTVGGDYYDWGLEADGLRFALADVAGKGAAAALMMTALRATIRAHCHEPDPTQMARRVNVSVHESVPPDRFATAFLAHLDPASGRLTYVNAGHNPPLLVRAAGPVETLDRGGLAFGLFEWASYDYGQVELERGDALIVFSDGVSETLSPDGEEFGPDRIAEIARRDRDAVADEIELAIRRELEAFSDGSHPTDDRTLIVLKREG